MVDIRLGAYEPAKLHLAFESLDIDFRCAQGGIVENGCLNFAGNNTVIDIFASAFGTRGRSTRLERARTNQQPNGAESMQ